MVPHDQIRDKHLLGDSHRDGAVFFLHSFKRADLDLPFTQVIHVNPSMKAAHGGLLG